MNSVTIVIFLALVAAFAVRACTGRGRLAARDRWALITGFVTALTACAIVTLPLRELIVPAVVWFVGVGLLTGGVFGTALRWPDLPWYAGAYPLWRAIRVVATLGIGLLLIGVAVG